MTAPVRDDRPAAEVPVSGRCHDRFAPVRDAFAANFVERGEVGAGLAVFVGGEPVVDLVGGWVDADRTRPWQEDTLVDVYSVGKAFVALLLLQLVDEGLVGLDDPLAAVWPEFADRRQGVGHRPPRPLPSGRRARPSGSPWSTPICGTVATMTDAAGRHRARGGSRATRHAYHTNTYGHLIGEPVRRAHRRPSGDPPPGPGRWSAPTCASVSPTTEQRRAAPTSCGPSVAPPPEIDPGSLTGDQRMVAMLSYFNPPGYSSVGVVNTPQWRATQVPSTNTHATAAGVARIYRALLEPGLLLSPDLLAEATSPQSVGLLPGARRGGHLRTRVQADHRPAPLRPESARPSATSAPEGRSGSPTPTPGWPSATR